MKVGPRSGAARMRPAWQADALVVLGHAAGVALLLAAWQLVVEAGIARELVVSKPTRIAAEFVAIATSVATWDAVRITLTELAIGLLIGGAAGVVLGALFARVPLLDRLFKPLVLALYTIPRLALLPLFIVWFGLGMGSKTAVVVVHGLVLFLLGTYAAVSSIEQRLAHACRLFGAGTVRVFLLVYVPHAIPYLITTARQGVGLALGSVVVAEMSGALEGMGFELSRRVGQFDMTGVLAWVLLAALIGLAIERLAVGLEKRLTRWLPSPHAG